MVFPPLMYSAQKYNMFSNRDLYYKSKKYDNYYNFNDKYNYMF